MDTLINEGLMLVSTLLVLPVAGVLAWAFFTGRLTRTESARYLPVMEPERDFWSVEEPAAENPARPRAAVKGGA